MAKEKPKEKKIDDYTQRRQIPEETAREIAGNFTENTQTTILDFFPEWERYIGIMAILSEPEEVAQTTPTTRRSRVERRAQQSQQHKASILAKAEQLQTDFGANWKRAILEGLHPKAGQEDFREWVEAFVAWQGFPIVENPKSEKGKRRFKIITALKYYITNRNLGELDLFLDDVESANFQQEQNEQTEGAYFLEQIEKRLPLERIAHYKKNNEDGALNICLDQTKYTPQQKADIKNAHYKELLNFDSLDNFLTEKQQERNDKKRKARRFSQK